ncbi:MAG TPA: PTS transporter subunit EIIC [Candidatus Paceibacterota bacterium]|nr:PTS transporter subunit EIIC [Verrucomicrobiota bacterium]HRY50502.1 PTS transporter subunit EIIC [Candidatus Paceibacterota bacterium]HSA02232.1 PTS transporter subunit EIIC [Candidatus Paceibacterota bacterium]
MAPGNEFLNKQVVPVLTALSENTYLSAIRAGMVSVVPLTIIGGLFMIVSYLPINGWETFIAPHLQLLQVPVTATFGLLAVFVCFAIGYDLGTRFKQEPIVSASMATLIFLLIQIQLNDQTLSMDGLGSKGLFSAILIAVISVRVQKFFTDNNVVIRLPDNVPPIVYESFLSLIPMVYLVLIFWLIRFVLGVDINAIVQTAFKPLVFALNTLPGILVYAFLVTLLWSVGINGDNAMDAIVAPIFLQYLAANVEATTQGQPLPYITAYGFFTAFVNVGGTGATIALALVMWNSREPGFRKVSRISLPTQIFQINEPIFFGFPIVLNPVFMVPYVLNALILTTGSFLLMQWNVIEKPFVNVPWTTPPIIGHYLVSGGDWKAAAWGGISIGIAMLIYFPFAKIAERQRLQAEAAGKAHE